jgi:hypothetical protein
MEPIMTERPFPQRSGSPAHAQRARPRHRCLFAGLLLAALTSGCNNPDDLSVTHYTVTIRIMGTGSGHVTGPYSLKDNVTLDCPGVCSARYQERESLTFTAVATSPSTFGKWEGIANASIDTAAAALKLDMTRDWALDVTFDAQPTATAITSDALAVALGAPFAFTITGTSFDVSRAEVHVTGPGCSPACVIGPGALNNRSPVTLSGTFTPPQTTGSYAFTVQNGPTGTPSTAQVVSLGCANPLVLSDDFESSKGWVAETPAGAPATNITITQETTGGSGGGGYRKMVHQLTPNASLIVYHWFPTTYTPSIQGAITSINYSEDRINLPPIPYFGSDIGSGFILDGGAAGKVAIAIPPGSFASQAWATGALSNLTQSRFGSIALNGSTPLRFGYYRSNGNGGSTSYTTTHGIDNFRVTLCR